MKSRRGSSAGSCQISAGTSSMAPTSTRVGGLAPALRQTLDLQIQNGAGRLELGALRDHREHDAQVAPGRRPQQRPQLLAQHGGPVEADADRAPAHRRVFLLLMGEIRQALVAADIERAEHDRPVAGKLEHPAVKLGLGFDIGIGRAGP